ncbi:hypothetical protein Bca4012_040506 [Brassica carinata]
MKHQYKETILSLNPSKLGAEDKLAWLGINSGEFTTKSGYLTAMKAKAEPESYSQHQAPLWYKSVWNLKVAPKVKLFVWKSLKKALSVGERLTERHINVDNRCKRCGIPESITHLLFHCHYAQQVWNLAPLASDFDPRGAIDLGDVWNALSLKRCLPPTGLVSGHLTPWILWAIWKDRNKLIFEGRTGSPEATLTSAITAAKEWDTKILSEKVSSRRPHASSVASTLHRRSTDSFRRSLGEGVFSAAPRE